MHSAVPSPTPVAHWNPSQSSSLERTMNTTTASPSSPASPRRLRGLSYLRSYTQNHILSRDSHSSSSNTNNNNNTSSQQRPSSLARSTSYPSPSSRGSATASNPPPNQNILNSPTSQRASNLPSTALRITNHENSPGASESGNLRISTEPQSISTPSAILSGNNTRPTSPGQTTFMARTRSATTGAVLDGAAEGNEGQEVPAPDSAVNGGNDHRGMSHQLPCIRFSAHQDPRAARPSLVFPSMSRTLPTGKETIKVGRFSERENMPAGLLNMPSSAPVGFKSKVVSRRHCEFWCTGGKWYIRDVKSSSGTFLNHIRLSSPGTESRPYQVNDGDIVQLGIDFKGGEEMIFRCVKIRVELNKGWQTAPSQFNVQSHKRLRELNNPNKTSGGSSQDCSICLGPVAPCQSLFVAPCSHTWHYKCIRVIINGPHWPHFICPNCRSVADLEADLDDPMSGEEEQWEELAAEAQEAVEPTQPADIPTVRTSSERVSHPGTSEAEQAQRLSLTDGEMEAAEISNQEPVGASDDFDIEQQGTSSDPDVEASDESDTSPLSHLEEFGTPNRSVGSSATTAPVDILTRKAIGSASTRIDRQATRTPSPGGLASSLDVARGGPEGPMTPRNDVGPFIFDGSAGRVSGARLVTNSLAAAAEIPAKEVSQNPA